MVEEACVPDDHGGQAQVPHHNEQDARRAV
jgi:hypothetical protein